MSQQALKVGILPKVCTIRMPQHFVDVYIAFFIRRHRNSVG